MAGNNKDVNLVIKAKNDASRAIDSVAEALKTLAKVQDDVTKGASKADGMLGQLGNALANLEQETRGLSALGTIGVQMDKAAGAVSRLQAATDKASADMANFAKASTTNQANLARLASEIDVQTKALEKQKLATDAAKVAQSAANKELGKAETVLRRLDARAANAKKPSDALTGQIASQRATVEQLKATQVAAQQNYDMQAASSTKAATALKDLNDQQTAALKNEKQIARGAAEAAEAFSNQSTALAKAQQALDDISTDAGRASQVLGGIPVTQDAIAAASARAAQDVAKLNEALARQSGKRATTGPAPDQSVAGYKQTVAAIQQAKVAYADARAEATKLGAAMAATTQPSTELQRAFLLAKEASAAAKAEFLAQGAALGKLRGVANSSFLEFSQAAGEQAKYVNATAAAWAKYNSSVASIAPVSRGVASSLTEAGAGAKSLGDGLASAGNSSREALSLMQRLRGEILTLTGSYVGLQAAIGQIGSVVDAFRTVEAVQNRLGAAFNQNTAEVGKQIEFLHQQADRLGISFETLGDEYSKLAVVAKEAGFSNAAIQKIFLGVAEAARVNKLSVQQTSLTFLALTQMINKGKVSSEELQRQMGEHLPGAFNIFAKSLGVTTEELIKMLKAGEVLSDQNTMVGFAEQLQKSFGPQLSKALESTTTQIGRLQNLIFESRLDAASGGIIDGLNQLLAVLNDFLRSEEAIRFFQQLSSVVGAAMRVLAQVPKYFTEIKIAAIAFTGVKIANFVLGVISSMGDLRKSLQATSAELALIGPRTLEASRAQGLLQRSVAVAAGALDQYRSNLLASAAASGGVSTGVRTIAAGLAGVRGTLVAVTEGFRALWAAMGGLPGLIITGVTTALGIWATSIDDATAHIDEHKKHVDAVVAAYNAAGGKAEDFRQKIIGVTKITATTDLTNATKDYDVMLDKIKQVGNGARVLAQSLQGVPGIDPKIPQQFKQITDLIDQLASKSITLDAFQKELVAISDAAADDKIKVLVSNLDAAAVAAQESGKNYESAKTLLETLTGTQDQAAEGARKLGGAISDAGDDAQQSANGGMSKYNDALDNINKQNPKLVQSLKDLKKYAVIDDAFIAGLKAIGDMGLKSAAAIDELTRRLEAAREAAKNAIDVSDITKGLDGLEGASAKAAAIISKFEGMRTNAYWDVNHFRVGFGSDTTTDEQGRVSETTKNTVVDLDGAIRDLTRRINAYLSDIAQAIGQDKFDELSDQQKGVLASIVHNYGKLPGDIVNALKNGSVSDVASAIRGHADDNNGVNTGRRNKEAALFEGATDSDTDRINKHIKAVQEETKQADEYHKTLQQTTADTLAEAKAKEEDGREGAILTAINKAQAEATKHHTTLTKEEIAAIREATGAKYDQAHAGEAEKKAKQEEAEMIQNLIGLDQQRKTAVQELQQAMKDGDGEKQDELRKKIADLNAEIAKGIPLARQRAEALGDQRGIAALDRITLKTQQLNVELFKASQINQMLADGLTNAFGTAIQGFVEAAQGARSWKDALKGARDAFLKFAADFLLQIAQMILKQALLNALTNMFGGSSGGGLGGILAGALNKVIHEGGVVGPGLNRSRKVNPMVFAGAPRFHAGGLPGLASDEIPAILQRGEEVLDKEDPRNILNGGAAAGGSSGSPTVKNDLKIITTFDPAEALAAAMDTVPGQQVIMNFFQRNRRQLRQVLG